MLSVTHKIKHMLSSQHTLHHNKPDKKHHNQFQNVPIYFKYSHTNFFSVAFFITLSNGALFPYIDMETTNDVIITNN